MPFYARTPYRRAGQIAADLFVVIWAIAWWSLGQLLSNLLRALARTTDAAASATANVRDQLTEVTDVFEGIPLAGERLAGIFAELAEVAQTLATATDGPGDALVQAATWTGWLTFLVPTCLLVLIWLPRRLRFARNARALLAIAERPGSQDLLALRALATLPPTELAQLDGDPVAAWRANHQATVAALAQRALVSAGVARKSDTAERPSTVVH
ncbi:MAG: hypothetical protein ACK5LN_05945 [Propioniciclava sp.]